MWTNKNKYILSKAYIDDFVYGKIMFGKTIDTNSFCAAKHVLRIALHKNNYLNVAYFFKKYKQLVNVFEVLRSNFSSSYSSKNIDSFINCVKTNNFIDVYKYAGGVLRDIRKQFNDIYLNNREQKLSYFESDFFRIVSSSPFRRLQDKTQLFLMDDSDHSRRRLTHSIEVSSIIQQIVANSKLEVFINSASVNNKFLTFDLDDSMSLCKTLGVLHDIGNPPFGHAGERIINNFFASKKDVLSKCDIGPNHPKFYNDLISFDGNAQSLRIASKLMPFNEKRGASLSAGVLGGLIKYPYCSNGKNKKIGYFLSEQSVIDDLTNLGVFIEGKRNPFACVLEAADDLAYMFSDLEDSIHKHILSYEDFLCYFKNSSDPKCVDFISRITSKMSAESRSISNRHENFERIIRPLLFQLREDIIVSLNYNNIGIEQSSGLNVYKHAVVKGVDEHFHLLDYSVYKNLIAILDKIKCEIVFLSRPIVINEIQGAKILTFLLEEFFDAIINSTFKSKANKFLNSKKVDNYEYKNQILSLIPEKIITNYKYEEKNTTKQMKSYLKMRVIVDFISGMTDNYAKKTYLELNAKK